MKDLRFLPKVRDSLSYLYVEHCRIDCEDKAIALHDAGGVRPVPCANLTTLMRWTRHHHHARGSADFGG